MAANQNITQITNIQAVYDPTTIIYGVPLATQLDTTFSGQVFATWLFNNSNLTGIPLAPTAVVNTATTQIATTAYVVNQGYLTSALAASTYLTQANAASTYATIANLALKAPIASPTFTGTVTIPGGASIAGYAPLASPTFTGTVTTAALAVSTTTPTLTLNDTAGTSQSRLNFSSSASIVWALVKQAGPTGAFTLSRYISSTVVDTPITVANATGIVTMPDGVANTPIGASGASTGAFTTLSASSTVSGTGFSTYLASPPAIGGTAAAAGSFTTLSATGTITPSQTNGIVGTTTNNNANAGSVGEHVTATGTAVSLTNDTFANITSISLTAGDWEVSGSTVFNPAGSTTMTSLALGISSTSATLPAQGFSSQIQTTFAIGTNQGMAAPTQRFLLSATTTIFLVTIAAFGASTMTTTGTLRARRVR